MHLRHLLVLLLLSATLWAVAVPNSAEAKSQGQDTAQLGTASRAKSWSCDDFHFKSVIPERSETDPNGWQEAEETLTIIDARHVIPNSWNCDVIIGLPFKALNGPIGPGYAACIAADVANTAADRVIDRQSTWTRGIFCHKFKLEMVQVFAEKYKPMGGRVQKCQ